MRDTIADGFLLAHPGTQYALRLAGELYKSSLLNSFYTGFAIRKPSLMASILTRCSASFETRILSEVPRSHIKTMPLIEVALLLRSGGRPTESAIHSRNERFQRSVPDCALERCEGAIGFDTSSWILAERVRAKGKPFVLDQSIGHPVAKREIYEKLRLRFPGWETSIKEKEKWLIDLEEREHSLASHIVVPSSFVADTLLENGVDPKKIHIIAFGTDLAKFRPSHYKPPPPLVFLFVGTLCARKGVPLLLEAWRKLAPRNAELWIAGPGDIPVFESSNLPNTVRLLGKLSRETLVKTLQKAHIFVFPSYFEGLAQVQIEALSTGLPVIGTRQSGVHEIIQDGETGLIVKTEVHDLMRAIEVFLETPDLASAMRQTVLEQRDWLGWGRYGRQWAQFLSQVDLA